jgi:hypothetical protein
MTIAIAIGQRKPDQLPGDGIPFGYEELAVGNPEDPRLRPLDTNGVRETTSTAPQSKAETKDIDYDQSTD